MVIEMNFEEMNFCQSCAMPMGEDDFGTEKMDLKVQITVNIAIKMVNLPAMLQWKK